MIDTKNPVVEFSAWDRCDRCQAQSYMSATRDELELLFCAHHGRKYAVALEIDGWALAYDMVALERLADNEKVYVG